MRFRVLGQSGLRVSAIGLGCMMFGWRADTAEVNRILEVASDGGINFIDTSGSYGCGASEELLGAALKRLGWRDDFIIATKFGLPSGKKPGCNAAGNSRHNVIRQCELSLKRLQVSHIDLLQIHRPSTDIPIDETLWALDLLVRQGKVRYIGSSNFSGWQIVESLWFADRRNLVPVTSEQVAYNLLDRHAEKEIFEITDRYKLGVITYSPLGEGLLTGKYRAGQSFPPSSRFAMATKGDPGSRMTPAVMRLVDMLVGAAHEQRISPACLAVAWVLRRQQVSTVLVGPSRSGQVEELIAAVDIDLPPSLTDGFDKLNEPGGTLTSYAP